MLSINSIAIQRTPLTIALWWLLLLVLSFTLFMPPAPTHIELPEIIFSLGLLSLYGCVIAANIYVGFDLQAIRLPLFLLLFFYAAGYACSAMIGLSESIGFMQVIRSTAPYLMFLPIVLLPRSLIPHKNRVLHLLIAIGLLQSLYIIGYFLYITLHTKYLSSIGIEVNSPMGVLIYRVTLSEPRCTIPFLLASGILPLHLLFTEHRLRHYIYSLCCVLLSLLATVVTLTRGLFLAMTSGWIVFLCFLLYTYRKSLRDIFQFNKHKFIITVSTLALLTGILFTPPVKYATHAMYARFTNHNLLAEYLAEHPELLKRIEEYMRKARERGETVQEGLLDNKFYKDYSNGRVQEEWLPALKTWYNSNLIHRIFGIGSGKPFYTLHGQPRTYIHNIFIYTLLYGGVFTLIVSLLFYAMIAWCYLWEAVTTQQMVNLSFLALFASISAYAQMFAVHKLLSFNAIFALLIMLVIYSKGHSNVRNRWSIFN